MHIQLSDHQKQIDAQQKELEKVQTQIRDAQFAVEASQVGITNQFDQIISLQSSLLTTQTNLDAQEKKIAGVEYWVQNLYGKMTNETFTVADKQRLLFVPATNKLFWVVLKLKHAPIQGSVRPTIIAGDGIDIPQLLPPRSTLDRNLLTCGLWNYNSNTLSLNIEYVMDSRETNVYQQMPPQEAFFLTGDFKIGIYYKFIKK